MRRGTTRVPVAEGRCDRSWTPEQYTNPTIVLTVLELLIEEPRTQVELFDLLCLHPLVEERAAGTIRAHVSASLLWLRRDGMAEPTGEREGGSYVWRAAQ